MEFKQSGDHPFRMTVSQNLTASQERAGHHHFQRMHTLSDCVLVPEQTERVLSQLLVLQASKSVCPPNLLLMHATICILAETCPYSLQNAQPLAQTRVCDAVPRATALISLRGRSVARCWPQAHSQYPLTGPVCL
jgi:hypothetical protein